MTTNGEWLDYLANNAPDELAAWFDAEHVEHQERALDGDTAPENADSRELILTDLEKKTREWHDYDGNYMRIYSDVAYAQVKELLDRQAAITSHQWELYHNDMMREWMAKTVELQEQVDELQAITDERWNKYIAEHLRADTLADDLLTANRQREQYRKLFGMALDWAHEITMLESSIDEGMA